MVLYHYTTWENGQKILRTRQWFPSTDLVNDSTYGQGYYCTDLDPSTSDLLIALYCWQLRDQIDKVRFYIKIQVPDTWVRRCRDHVYLIPSDAISQIQVLDSGDKPSVK